LFYINSAEFESVLDSVRNYSHYTIWINFFLTALIIATENTIYMIDSLHKLREINCRKIKNAVKETSVALLVYESLWEQPKVEIKDLVIRLGLSYDTKYLKNWIFYLSLAKIKDTEGTILSNFLKVS